MTRLAELPVATLPPRRAVDTAIVFAPKVPHNCAVRLMVELPVLAIVVFAVMISVEKAFSSSLVWSNQTSKLSVMISTLATNLAINYSCVLTAAKDL
jgi:hypothetical protein